MKLYDTMHRLLILSVAVGCLGLNGCVGTSWFKRGAPDAVVTSDSASASSPEKSSAAAAKKSRPKPSSSELSRSSSAASQSKSADSKEAKSQFAQQFSRARGFEAEKKYEQARSIYEQLIVQYPERYESYHRLAVVADQQRRHREAEALYAEALRLEPMSGSLLGDLGYCYFLQGKLTKAESALAKAVAIEPAEIRHRNNLGLVYGHQGKNEEALENFRRGGSEADAQYNLAFVLASQDKGEEAKSCFHAALMADPAHEKSHTALASFERYERTPEELRDEFTGSVDGRWVPYVEGAGDGSQVVQASATSHSQALRAQARDMMSSRSTTTR